MNGRGAYLEPYWADQRFLKEFSELSQLQNFKDPSVAASLRRERVSGGGGCVHAPGEGRLGEGPQLSGINSRGRRERAKGCVRREEAGSRDRAEGGAREALRGW